MNEFNTGKINLEPSEDKQKWYCPLCDDYHTEDKEIYDDLFEKEPDCKDIEFEKFLRELPRLSGKEEEK